MPVADLEDLICERAGCGHAHTLHDNERGACSQCACLYFTARIFPCEECSLPLACGRRDCSFEAKCPSCGTTNECPNHEVD